MGCILWAGVVGGEAKQCTVSNGCRKSEIQGEILSRVKGRLLNGEGGDTVLFQLCCSFLSLLFYWFTCVAVVNFFFGGGGWRGRLEATFLLFILFSLRIVRAFLFFLRLLSSCE